MALISKTGAALESLTLFGHSLIDQGAAYNPAEICFGSLLAPWPNRLAGGSYQLAGRSFETGSLDADGNANHGLVFDRDFELVRAGDAEIVLSYRFGNDPGYPFNVELEVCYELLDKGMRVSATANNLGAEAAPFAIGFHPYFLAQEPFELSGEFTETIQTDSKMLPVNRTEAAGLSYSGGELDSCYLGAREVRLKTESFELVVELEKNLDHFMFYRPSSDQGGSMIAIEPMSSPANAFATEIETHLIAPGESREFSYLIRMS
jgi:aldose 1-epimerase